MILVNSGAFLSISSWFCELTELIFVMIPYISSTSYPPKTQGIMGHVQVANNLFYTYQLMDKYEPKNYQDYYRLLDLGCYSDQVSMLSLLLGLSKGNARVEISALFFFFRSATVCNFLINTHARRFY